MGERFDLLFKLYALNYFFLPDFFQVDANSFFSGKQDLSTSLVLLEQAVSDFLMLIQMVEFGQSVVLWIHYVLTCTVFVRRSTGGSWDSTFIIFLFVFVSNVPRHIIHHGARRIIKSTNQPFFFVFAKWVVPWHWPLPFPVVVGLSIQALLLLLNKPLLERLGSIRLLSFILTYLVLVIFKHLIYLYLLLLLVGLALQLLPTLSLKDFLEEVLLHQFVINPFRLEVVRWVHEHSSLATSHGCIVYDFAYLAAFDAWAGCYNMISS